MAHTLSQQEFTALNQGSVSRLSSAKIVPPLIAMGLPMLAAWLLSTIISDSNSNPVAVLLLISGIVSIFYALMRPWNSLLVFVWLAMTIDAIKRMTFALSTMNFIDVAQILIVPVLLMGGIYMRIIFLHWFVAHSPAFGRGHRRPAPQGGSFVQHHRRQLPVPLLHPRGRRGAPPAELLRALE